MLSDHNYTCCNETADTHDSVPAMSRDVLAQGTVDTDDTRYYNRMNGQTPAQYVAVHEIKVEYDGAANQENISTEQTTSRDTVCRSTTTEDVIHDIKAENDHDVECGSTTTKALFADDIKVEIKQEIITPEDCTNIDMVCRSLLPSNVSVNSVKVENCVMNQDDASEGATNTDVKRGDVLLGEDYSSAAGLPAAETIHKVWLSDTAVPHVTKISDDLIRRSYDMRTPGAERPFPCVICNKPFRSLSSLREHIDEHLGVKPYFCKVCNKRFSLKGNLTSHMSIHLGDKPFSCEVCHKPFRQKGNLLNHMRTHLVEKPFSCYICHKTFCQKGALKIHIARHSEAKPFPCDICQKAFKVKGNLIEHMKTHSEEKPFSCEICNKTFTRKSSLTSHLRTHSGERPFSCHICNKAFGQKCTLTLHLGTHSGVKPFSCDTCGRAFVLKSNLVKHMQVHSGEKPFSCEVCGKAFRRNSGFKAHLRTHLHLKRHLEP